MTSANHDLKEGQAVAGGLWAPGTRKVVAAFLVGTLVGALSAIEIVPDFKGKETGSVSPLVSGAIQGDGNLAAAGGVGGTITGPQAGESGVAGTQQGAAGGGCTAGQNAATDQGVGVDTIRMATTVVDTGIGAAFLRDVRFAMEAVRNKVNRDGGICGRRLEIRYIDDGWDPQRGAQFLRSLIFEPDPGKKIFAIPVGPSSEGLRVVINSGDIDKAEMPVVGADGLLIEQYLKEGGGAQPWVWPVAVSTAASARIMVREAVKRGAKSFAIVFDKNYRFGVEGALAFNAEVKRVRGHNVEGFNQQNNCQKKYCGIFAGQSSYGGEAQSFEETPDDFVALFLEPQTALTWMNDPNVRAGNQTTYGYGGAQPLFTRSFAVNCQEKCDQMQIWTGFKPFIEQYKNDPKVRDYVQDLKRTNPQADEFNAFAQGGYVGMLLLVEALRRIGTNLTRQRLRDVLNSIDLSPGLTIDPTLSWRPNSRFAANTMQMFTINYKGTFGGWRAGPIVSDPNPGVGIS